MSRAKRSALIERENPTLPISQQCRLLAVSRSSVYRRLATVSEEDRAIMALIDRQYLALRCWFPLGLVDHFLGWIEPDEPRSQFGCQHLGKAPGAAAKVHDQRDGGPVDMGR